MQQFSSKNTSLNQIPKLAKFIDISNETVLLDWGCGGYTKFEQFVNEKGGTYFGYDPYWKTPEENSIATSQKPTVITCANVLNVIAEDSIIDNIVRLISNYDCEAIFQIYEGNKSGEGKITSKGFQRNQPAVYYSEIFHKYFDNVIRKGNIYFCKNDSEIV